MQTLSLPYDPPRLSQLDTFTAINLDDLVTAVGWPVRSVGARLLRRLFLQPARTFARQMVEFDANVGGLGLIEGSRRLQRTYVRDVRVHGRERLPEGPALFLSNHPGMTDTVSLFAALGRSDLRIIALKRPFLSAMPNMDRQLYHVLEEPAARMGLVRAVSTHLRAGGAVLTFPAGQIEPDPALTGGAAASLETWTDSVGVFVRMAPGTAVVPVLVRGVVWKGAGQSPLLAFKRTHEEKERLAAAIQLLGMIVFKLRPVTVHVQIGEPIRADRLGLKAVQDIHRAVLAGMRSLIECPPEDPGESVL